MKSNGKEKNIQELDSTFHKNECSLLKAAKKTGRKKAVPGTHDRLILRMIEAMVDVTDEGIGMNCGRLMRDRVMQMPSCEYYTNF